MKIAIIDAACQDIGLKILFPGGDYFIDHYENHTHSSRKSSETRYNFTPETDW